jgi:hypothetical protein
VIAVKRPDALPRKGNVSTARRKPVQQPTIDGAMETSASRRKTTRAAGLASGKVKAAAVEALAIAETEVEASAIVAETTIVEAPLALPVEAVTSPNTEIGPSSPPPAPAPQRRERPLIAVVSRMLSTLRRWTGVRL